MIHGGDAMKTETEKETCYLINGLQYYSLTSPEFVQHDCRLDSWGWVNVSIQDQRHWPK